MDAAQTACRVGCEVLQAAPFSTLPRYLPLYHNSPREVP